jgi:hypothetical protein
MEIFPLRFILFGISTTKMNNLLLLSFFVEFSVKASYFKVNFCCFKEFLKFQAEEMTV